MYELTMTNAYKSTRQLTMGCKIYNFECFKYGIIAELLIQHRGNVRDYF